jgi:hypothetical protein
MRNELQITGSNEIPGLLRTVPDSTEVDAVCSHLQQDGVVALTGLVSSETLRAMQAAFAARLQQLRFNNLDGYQKTEPYRHMIEDALTLDQGFMDLALHPLVKEVLNRYLGDEYELTEAKGWKSLPTRRDFHGWHGDAWYDQTTERQIHKEVKLAIYLTDVRSGAFNYIKGSHRQQHPRIVKNSEVEDVSSSRIAKFLGSAGTAFLFDTSGIHRQSVPMLEERQACFFNYHDPGVRLQQEDIDYYRYHPLILNAAFLGNLSDEDQRILGFGNKTNFVPAFARVASQKSLYRTFRGTLDLTLRAHAFRERVYARLRRMRRRD